MDIIVRIIGIDIIGFEMEKILAYIFSIIICHKKIRNIIIFKHKNYTYINFIYFIISYLFTESSVKILFH